MKTFELAKRKNPQWPQSRFGLALAHFRLRRFDKSARGAAELPRPRSRTTRSARASWSCCTRSARTRRAARSGASIVNEAQTELRASAADRARRAAHGRDRRRRRGLDRSEDGPKRLEQALDSVDELLEEDAAEPPDLGRDRLRAPRADGRDRSIRRGRRSTRRRLSGSAPARTGRASCSPTSTLREGRPAEALAEYHEARGRLPADPARGRADPRDAAEGPGPRVTTRKPGSSSTSSSRRLPRSPRCSCDRGRCRGLAPDAQAGGDHALPARLEGVQRPREPREGRRGGRDPRAGVTARALGALRAPSRFRARAWSSVQQPCRRPARSPCDGEAPFAHRAHSGSAHRFASSCSAGQVHGCDRYW